jgi:4-amino-4-deoxy-L-arabinose transferase-like glycosyltransferase
MIWSRPGIRFVAAALDRRTGTYLVLALIAVHVVAWTIISTVAKSGQAPNPDSTEAYAWGRLWLWGYGKHPPLSAWTARLWFDVFPTADWAMYALAMTVIGLAAWACWLLALRVVDRRRAMVVVLLLLIYPVFYLRGPRFNPDLLQVPMFLLVVLTFLVAFETRAIAWGVVLGLVCACAVLTKYWALLVVSAIGLAAIVHPDRGRFFLSWTPYVATIVFLVALLPHLIWLAQSGYAPFAYAARHLKPAEYSPLAKAGATLVYHAALLLPVGLVFAWAVCRPRLRPATSPPVVRLELARHIWLIAGVLAVLPAIMAVVLGVDTAFDWGKPQFTLLPLAAIAIPRLGVARRALARVALVWAVTIVVGFSVAPIFPMLQLKTEPVRYLLNEPAEKKRYLFNEPDVAAKTTQLWRERYGTPLPVIAGPTFIAAPISFYSPDHPVMFANFDSQIAATWIDPNALEQSGFLAICPEPYASFCESGVAAISPRVERVVLSQQPNRFKPDASALRWIVYLVGPGDRGAGTPPPR